MRVIKVEWEDAVITGTEWYTDSEYEVLTLSKVVSIGWELKNNSEYVMLALSMANENANNEQYSNILLIPRTCISELTVVTP